MAGLKLKMLTKQEFVPEHGETYIAFLISDFYGDLEYVELECEFHYQMIDAETGYCLGTSAVYNGDNGIPFHTPMRYEAKNRFKLLTEEEKETYKYHEEEDQRFWWEKTWFLSDRRNLQIHPEELDEMSIGIMKKKDFMYQVREANKFRVATKEENKT